RRQVEAVAVDAVRRRIVDEVRVQRRVQAGEDLERSALDDVLILVGGAEHGEAGDAALLGRAAEEGDERDVDQLVELRRDVARVDLARALTDLPAHTRLRVRERLSRRLALRVLQRADERAEVLDALRERDAAEVHRVDVRAQLRAVAEVSGGEELLAQRRALRDAQVVRHRRRRHAAGRVERLRVEDEGEAAARLDVRDLEAELVDWLGLRDGGRSERQAGEGEQEE